jgi:hypothetical protein
VLVRAVTGLNISFEVEVYPYNVYLTPDVADTVKGVINFFGDVEPKSIGDNDEDKIYWYMKVPPFLYIFLTVVITSLYWSSQSYSTT